MTSGHETAAHMISQSMHFIVQIVNTALNNDSVGNATENSFCINTKKCDDTPTIRAVSTISITFASFYFATAFIFYFLSTCKHTLNKSKFRSTITFHIFILLCCVGRFVYFFGQTIFELLFDFGSINVDDSYRQFFLIPYHIASSCFYCAFIALSINIAELFFNAYGMQSKAKIMNNPILVSLATVIIFVVQLAATILFTGANFYFRYQQEQQKQENPNGLLLFSISYVLQLLFHMLLSWLVMLIFIFCITFAYCSIWKGKHLVHAQQKQTVFRLVLISIVVCFLFLFRGGLNIIVAGLNLFCSQILCPEILGAIFAWSCVLFDGIPLFLFYLVFGMGDLAKQTSTSSEITSLLSPYEFNKSAEEESTTAIVVADRQRSNSVASSVASEQ